MSTNILLMCGGDGSEHEISLLSAKFIEKQLNLTKDFNVIKVVIHNHQFMVDEKPQDTLTQMVILYSAIKNKSRLCCSLHSRNSW